MWKSLLIFLFFIFKQLINLIATFYYLLLFINLPVQSIKISYNRLTTTNAIPLANHTQPLSIIILVSKKQYITILYLMSSLITFNTSKKQLNITLMFGVPIIIASFTMPSQFAIHSMMILWQTIIAILNELFYVLFLFKCFLVTRLIKVPPCLNLFWLLFFFRKEVFHV